MDARCRLGGRFMSFAILPVPITGNAEAIHAGVKRPNRWCGPLESARIIAARDREGRTAFSGDGTGTLIGSRRAGQNVQTASL